ncbi:TPA: helix-turn-helix transcriptional regulator [Listeria monocytogenes]|uniref:Helix-turn-helix transcriptional regulator n=4 Tax=Listeria monocytogenes TaxID=1639 RepID=A0A5Z1JF72_LISMN|nr:helix-turn-helix transcriptional regulator [Listeria monocytogenes]ALD11404.1 XRE family transcriptional regulator [Listeria monocytogenes J1816]EAE1680311.1 XRE family transcriptional regulator [Listeria monocytogenes LIS0071]EAL10355.1 putative immunity repressor protein [Listeria monocytogenes str. 4b H7858] [Listeria monocytogenes serotype 4b str. H7858]EHC6164242.1 helix-turn-helix transcriptional regulator [Listeria monocytogenes serotype 1/2b]MCX62684.1 XRE family transcriptional reg
MQKIRPDMDIGKNIQRLRNNSKMTQDQVVAKMNIMGLNISKSTYAKLETNRMNIRVSELVALKIIFDANFNDFFEDLILK